MNELPPNHNRGQWQSLFVSHTDKATHCLIDCLFNGLSLSVGFRPIGPQTPKSAWKARAALTYTHECIFAPKPAKGGTAPTNTP